MVNCRFCEKQTGETLDSTLCGTACPVWGTAWGENGEYCTGIIVTEVEAAPFRVMANTPAAAAAMFDLIKYAVKEQEGRP